MYFCDNAIFIYFFPHSRGLSVTPSLTRGLGASHQLVRVFRLFFLFVFIQSEGKCYIICMYIYSYEQVGLLPVPHPILIRRYQANPGTTMWFRYTCRLLNNPCIIKLCIMKVYEKKNNLSKNIKKDPLQKVRGFLQNVRLFGSRLC